MKKTLTSFAALLLTAILVTGCTSGQTSGAAITGAAVAETSLSAAAETSITAAAVVTDTSELFTDRDMETGYDVSHSIAIVLRDGASSSDSPNITISGDTVTITGEGVYVLTGTLTNGQIIVNCPIDQKVQLVLDGASIACNGSAALYVKQADKVFLTTVSGTENTLYENGDYQAIDDQNINAAVYARSDLTLNGAGVLTVTATDGHGIVSKDDLVATSGTYRITAAKCAMSGNNSVLIANGTYTLVSGSDGIRSDNGDKATQGHLYIANGNFDITAGTDGLDVQDELRIDNGTFTIAASNDALDAGGNMIINGGMFMIMAGDDAVHADTDVMISGGTLDIRKSYEGIEGRLITIAGGSITLISSDDGLNAVSPLHSGKVNNPTQNDSDCGITISGGSLTINASGDGIDSNGALTVSGGSISISGPTVNREGALDAGVATVTGGTLIAAGSSGMTIGFGTGSTQGSILYTLAGIQQAGTGVTLLNASGEVIAQITPDKAFQSLNISAPGILAGCTYTLKVGSEQYAITMDTLAWSNGGTGGFGRGMHNIGPGMGTPPEGRRRP